MAKFCENCGNPVDESAVFCENCGVRLGGAPAVQSAVQPTVQPPVQPSVQPTVQPPVQTPVRPAMQQPVRPPVQQAQYARPVTQQARGNIPYAYPQPPQPPKKKKGGLIALIIGAVAAVLAAVVLVVFVILPKLGFSPEEEDLGESIESSEVSAEVPAESETPRPMESTAEPVASTAPSPEPAEEDLPDFEKYGIAADIKPGETFDVITQVLDSDEFILGNGRLDLFTREPVSQEIVDFMRGNGADVNGYEVLHANFVIEYPRSMVNTELMKFNGLFDPVIFDYYHIDLFIDSTEKRKDTEGEDYTCYEVIADGETKNVYFWGDLSANLDGDTLYYHEDCTFLTPAGYDGLVCGYRDIRLPKARIYENYSEGRYQLARLIGGDTPAPDEEPVSDQESTNGELPYADSLGAPADTDFVWIADAQSGGLSDAMLGKNDFIGKWKAEIIFDGIFELMTITIDRDGTVTFSPYQYNEGSGWKDESGESPYTLKGEFDCGGAGNIIASGSYGNLDLYQFLESGGTQYGLGELTVPSGETGKVYLVRP